MWIPGSSWVPENSVDFVPSMRPQLHSALFPTASPSTRDPHSRGATLKSPTPGSLQNSNVDKRALNLRCQSLLPPMAHADHAAPQGKSSVAWACPLPSLILSHPAHPPPQLSRVIIKSAITSRAPVTCLSPSQEGLYYLHSKARKGKVAGPRSHSWEATGPRFETRQGPLWSLAPTLTLP